MRIKRKKLETGEFSFSMTITCSIANQNAGFALVHWLDDTNFHYHLSVHSKRRVRELISSRDPILKGISLKLFLEHCRSKKSQAGIKIANPVTRTFLTRTVQTPLQTST